MSQNRHIPGMYNVTSISQVYVRGRVRFVDAVVLWGGIRMDNGG